MIYKINDLDIFPGFYESVLLNSDTEYDFNYDERCASDDPEKYVEKELKYDGFTKEVCEGITALIGDIMGAEAKFHELDSPRYYNYTTDKLCMDIAIDPNEIEKEIRSNKDLYDGFNKYLHRHYTSCSGFISFVENNVEDYFAKKEYPDVMVDYYLLTKIYDDADVVLHQDNGDDTTYFEAMIGIAQDALWENMVEPKKR